MSEVFQQDWISLALLIFEELAKFCMVDRGKGTHMAMVRTRARSGEP